VEGLTIYRGPLVDGVQESDGAHVVATPLPGFEQGLFVTQDGDDLDASAGSRTMRRTSSSCAGSASARSSAGRRG